MLKKILLLSMVPLLIFVLVGCSSPKSDTVDVQTTQEDRSSFSIKEGTPPSEESGDVPMVQGLRAPYYIGEFVHADLIFRGTITSVERFEIEVERAGGTIVTPVTDCLITVRIEKIYSGTPPVKNDEILLYCGDTAATDGKNISEGLEFVFFTMDVGDDWRSWFKEKVYVREGYDKMPDMALYSNYWDMSIYKEGLVQLPFVWGDEYKPSVTMGEEEQEKFVAGWAARPEVTLRGVYYTEDDFIKALEYLKGKFPAIEPQEEPLE